MPYNMLLGLKKAAAKREARDREVVRALQLDRR
jgi:hypothetical protein